MQEQWNGYFARFVADVAGEDKGEYPTCHDGRVACKVMDITREDSLMVSIREE